MARRITYIGTTVEDEMCNFYMMYWVKGKEVMTLNSCFTRVSNRRGGEEVETTGNPSCQMITISLALCAYQLMEARVCECCLGGTVK
jgi:hypothetical protein